MFIYAAQQSVRLNVGDDGRRRACTCERELVLANSAAWGPTSQLQLCVCAGHASGN